MVRDKIFRPDLIASSVRSEDGSAVSVSSSHLSVLCSLVLYAINPTSPYSSSHPLWKDKHFDDPFDAKAISSTTGALGEYGPRPSLRSPPWSGGDTFIQCKYLGTSIWVSKRVIGKLIKGSDSIVSWCFTHRILVSSNKRV